MQKILNGLDAQIALAPRGSAQGICTHIHQQQGLYYFVMLKDQQMAKTNSRYYPLLEMVRDRLQKLCF